MQIRLCLLHRADGAKNIGIGFIRVILLEGIILALEGHIVCITGHQDQIVPFHIHTLDDLLIETAEQFLVLQLGLPKVHQQLMLQRACHLRGLKGNVDQILSNGAGKGSSQQGKVFIGLIFRHHASGLTELRNDLLVFVDIAAVNGGYITAVPAQVPPNLADFLIDHGYFLTLVKVCRGIIAYRDKKIQ